MKTGTTISNVRLAGIASAVPPLRTIPWEDLDVPPERHKRSREQRRTPAIRAAAWEQCQSDYCQRAAETLLSRLGWAAAEIDVVIFVTLTPDYPIPATAIILQDRLGISKKALAFDLPGGEVTFLQGLQLLASMLSGGHLRRGLLLCGGVSKVVENPASIESVDRICGHNGSVCALEYVPGADPMYFHSGGDGAAHRAYYMPIGGTRRPPEPKMFRQEDSAIADNPAMRFALDMAAVEAAAQRELPNCIRTVSDLAGRRPAEMDYCFLQPISLATDDAIRQQLGISRDRFHSMTCEYGSGSSGGIVLAMLARAATSLAGSRRTSLLAGAGAGLAWASAVVTTQNLVCPEPIEM
jgi:3-oxoacyl-[acyl-carrier-protein] synthase-3